MMPEYFFAHSPMDGPGPGRGLALGLRVVSVGLEGKLRRARGRQVRPRAARAAAAMVGAVWAAGMPLQCSRDLAP